MSAGLFGCVVIDVVQIPGNQVVCGHKKVIGRYFQRYTARFSLGVVGIQELCRFAQDDLTNRMLPGQVDIDAQHIWMLPDESIHRQHFISIVVRICLEDPLFEFLKRVRQGLYQQVVQARVVTIKRPVADTSKLRHRSDCETFVAPLQRKRDEGISQ